MDSACGQYKLEAGKMLENGDESHLPALGALPRVQGTRYWACCLDISQLFLFQLIILKILKKASREKIILERPRQLRQTPPYLISADSFFERRTANTPTKNPAIAVSDPMQGIAIDAFVGTFHKKIEIIMESKPRPKLINEPWDFMLIYQLARQYA